MKEKNKIKKNVCDVCLRIRLLNVMLPALIMQLRWYWLINCQKLTYLKCEGYVNFNRNVLVTNCYYDSSWNRLQLTNTKIKILY